MVCLEVRRYRGRGAFPGGATHLGQGEFVDDVEEKLFQVLHLGERRGERRGDIEG